MSLSMHRGDTYSFKLTAKYKGGASVEPIDQIYFTAKKSHHATEYLFQKTLGNGITQMAPGEYVVSIAPEDTDKLSFVEYYCDVEIVSASLNLKRTKLETLQILPEVTHAGNEGGGSDG